MTGFTPDEGKTLVARNITKQDDPDRGTDLELLLFTNAVVDNTITEATLTEPVGAGYARKTLTDANWGMSGVQSIYVLQTFSAGAGGWTGDVYGYAIVTKGTTPRILTIEVDVNGPYNFSLENSKYDVTPILAGG